MAYVFFWEGAQRVLIVCKITMNANATIMTSVFTILYLTGCGSQQGCQSTVYSWTNWFQYCIAPSNICQFCKSKLKRVDKSQVRWVLSFADISTHICEHKGLWPPSKFVAAKLYLNLHRKLFAASFLHWMKFRSFHTWNICCYTYEHGIPQVWYTYFGIVSQVLTMSKWRNCNALRLFFARFGPFQLQNCHFLYPQNGSFNDIFQWQSIQSQRDWPFWEHQSWCR